MLKEVVLELSAWHQQAENTKAGGNLFSYGLDLASWFREQLEAHAEVEVLAARDDRLDEIGSSHLDCWVRDNRVEKFDAEKFETETAKLIEAAKKQVVVRPICCNRTRRY